NEYWLVPRYVPLTTPPTAADPPARFVELANSLVNCRDHNQRRGTQEQMVRIYSEHRNAKIYPEGDTRLLFGNESIGHFPSDDHCRMFRDKRGFIWTSQ